MSNQYYKNFILWGEVDFYCLLCEENFQDLTELDKHIRWENHRKVLKAQVKSHKFKKETIYQVGELYYCEICNYVTANIKTDDMNLHISSEEHNRNKQEPKSEAELTNTPCKRDTGYIIANDIIIEEKDWNCITHVENYCLVCGIYLSQAYQYVTEHMKAPRHLINLIAARVVIDDDKIYRKLYSNYFYCLCCKEAQPMTFFEGHWDTKDHGIYKNDCIFTTTYANANATRAIEEKRIKLEKSLIFKHQAQYYDIFEERNSAICKQCQCLVKLDFKTMNDHNKSHNEHDVDKPDPAGEETSKNVDSSSEEDTYKVVFTELMDHGQRRKELAIYGKKNYIKLNSGGSKGYCSICCSTISGHLKLFKEHARGARHRGHLELKGLKKSKVHKVPEHKLKTFTESIDNLYFSEETELVCLNREVCIDIFSFILVYEIDKRFQYKATKCLLCDVFYPYSYDFDHFATEEHKRRFLSVKVLAIEREFVREIRPDVYHCGTCNKIYPFWELMEKHLLSKPHIDTRKVNKYKGLERKSFDETQLVISSKNPDILYIQLLTIGIVKSKSVISMKDMRVNSYAFKKPKTKVTNAYLESMKSLQLVYTYQTGNAL